MVVVGGSRQIPVSPFCSSCFLCSSHRASRCSALFSAACQRAETRSHLPVSSAEDRGPEERRASHLVLPPQITDHVFLLQDGHLDSSQADKRQRVNRSHS